MPVTTKNHRPTLRLLASQVKTVLGTCGELRADLRTLDDQVEQIHIALAKGPPICAGCQALQLDVVRLKERMSVIVGVLAILQILSTAIVAYLATGK